MGAVCDPIDDAQLYLRAAKECGLEIRYVFDTHVHADHLSGARKLAETAGATYVLQEGTPARFDFHGVREGDTLELGNVCIQVLHTPGHTPEHVSLLVTDETRSVEPWFLLTGHTLMVGDVGRTELVSAPEEGARALFESIKKLRALPDFIEVWPGAFSGSVCGRGLSGKAVSTIGFERKFNRAFLVEKEEDFVALMLKDIPPRPTRAEEIRSANLGFLTKLA